jgi:hypothetical protein
MHPYKRIMVIERKAIFIVDGLGDCGKLIIDPMYFLKSKISKFLC